MSFIKNLASHVREEEEEEEEEEEKAEEEKEERPPSWILINDLSDHPRRRMVVLNVLSNFVFILCVIFKI